MGTATVRFYGPLNEECVEVRAQEQRVRDLVPANQSARFDVCRFEHRERPFVRYNAAALVCVHGHYPERALTQLLVAAIVGEHTRCSPV